MSKFRQGQIVVCKNAKGRMEDMTKIPLIEDRKYIILFFDNNGLAENKLGVVVSDHPGMVFDSIRFEPLMPINSELIWDLEEMLEGERREDRKTILEPVFEWDEEF